MATQKFTGSLLLATSLLGAQTDFRRLDQLGESELQQSRIPGLMLVVVESDKVTYAKGFGVASVETKEPVTPDHLFRVGSTTKMMVATAILRLAESGKLKLTDAAGDYIRDVDPMVGRVTLQQLLTHTAGLMDLTLMQGPHDDEALAANVRQLRADALFTQPGQIQSYSNLGYVILGRVVEIVANRPFADAMKELVFEPLGMKRTTFRPTMAMTWPLAQGHSMQGGTAAVVRPAGDHAGYWPAGSMFTSGNDFARMAIAILNDGNNSISPGVVKDLLTPRVDVPGGRSRYGFGLGFLQIGGEMVAEHGGARLGYTSQLIVAPSRKTAIITMGNVSGPSAAGLAWKALDAISGLKPAPELSGPATNLAPEKLTGIYSQGSRFASVQAENGKLYVSVEGLKGELTPTVNNCFKTASSTACFVLGADGRARYLSAGGRVLERR